MWMICVATTLDGHKDALVDQVYTVVTRYESYPKHVEILWHNVTSSMLEERQHKNITSRNPNKHEYMLTA
jgi:hypothetical protein